MRNLLLLASLIAAGPAAATQEYILPTLFDVTGVAADDVLNIRAEPSASAEIIGTLAPDATRIEVVGVDASGDWGRVNTAERSGWSALRFLAYRVDVWEEGAVPPSLHCLGTEPFWSLVAEGSTLRYKAPDEPGRSYDMTAILASGVFRDPRRTLIGERPDGRVTAVILPAECSDGMSDHAYGLDATVILEAEGGARMLTGCCSIAP